MDLLPIFLNIRDRKCVIVGGGSVALRKANLLSRAQAKLYVVATSICEELEALCISEEAAVRLEDGSSPPTFEELMKWTPP